jgi:hypothetical protein
MGMWHNMRKIYILIGALAMLGTAMADPISIEEFKKLQTEGERLGAMDRAPAEQKQALMKIHVHMSLVKQYGEKEFRLLKEWAVAQKRGLLAMESIYFTQNSYWSSYINGLYDTYEKAGLTTEEQQKKIGVDADAYNAVVERGPVLHALAFKIAASPQALELEKKVDALNKKWKEGLELILSTPGHFVTKEEMQNVDKQMDEVFQEMKRLPTLSPGDLQKEYDDFPEMLMYLKEYPIRR